MNSLDLSLPTPEENLALEEALLGECDAGRGPEVLRFWESESPFVVLGYGNSASAEADLEACKRDGIPVLRRVSGGGTVLQAPGCLNYAVVLRVDSAPELSSIRGTNQYVLDRVRSALEAASGLTIDREGDTDLAVEGIKCSGNAQRRGRQSVLFHGALLLNMDLALISRYLRMPSRQPKYRENRPHAAFLRNLEVDSSGVKRELRRVLGAGEVTPSWPMDEVARLIEQKYSRQDWNLRV